VHSGDSQELVVLLGAEAPLVQLQRTLLQACEQLVVRPSGDAALLRLDHRRVAFVELELDVNVPRLGHSMRVDTGLVRARHTPSATLRRVVSRAAARFGSVSLFVRRGRSLRMRQPRSFRVQVTSLSGFLRSGRVVQENTLLHIVAVSLRQGRECSPRVCE